MNFSFNEAAAFVYKLQNNPDLIADYLPNKNRIDIYSLQHKRIALFKLPLPMPNSAPNNETFVLESKQVVLPDYAIVHVQTGDAALAIVKNGSIEQHKVIRKYMTRKKQGKSQLKYLKTKGKSRAGSRVRLANAVLFFEEINSKLTEWFSSNHPAVIAYSCTPQLWGMLFQSKIAAPFKKDDPRLKKIPFDLGIPKYEKLSDIARKITHGSLEVTEQGNTQLQNLIYSILPQNRSFTEK